MNKKKEQTPAEFRATAKNLADQLCPAQKHLDNIIKILPNNNYDDVNFTYILVYLEMMGLISDSGFYGKELDHKERRVNEILGKSLRIVEL